MLFSFILVVDLIVFRIYFLLFKWIHDLKEVFLKLFSNYYFIFEQTHANLETDCTVQPYVSLI